jgi:dienelactone hydrolase
MAALVLLVSGCASTPMPVGELSARLSETNLLLKPPGDGPFPAVVLLHTCYGNLGHVDRWAEQLRSRGYVTLVLNSMAVRELDGYFERMGVCGGMILRPPDRARDVSLGLERLRSLHYVDGERIAIVGFSHGGWTALSYVGSAPSMHLEGAPPLGVEGIRAVVTVYPYCGGEAQEGLETWPADTRILMLLAGSDTVVGTRKCTAYAERQQERGVPVTLHVYPGAKHGYDVDPKLIYDYDEVFDAEAAEDTRRRIREFLDQALIDR